MLSWKNNVPPVSPQMLILVWLDKENNLEMLAWEMQESNLLLGDKNIATVWIQSFERDRPAVFQIGGLSSKLFVFLCDINDWGDRWSDIIPISSCSASEAEPQSQNYW